ncbi:MAG: G5 domain-containing protein [Actinomycetota bacterium]|nr:G5 domain-containing protein [Actinomycetota bacterium]
MSRSRTTGSPSRTRRLVAHAAVLVLVTAGTGAFATLHKSVEVNVNGTELQVSTFGRTVGDVLVAAGVEVGSRDLVVPEVSAPASSGDEIVVRHARELELVVDGEPRTVWTTALTVGDAVEALGERARDADVSVSRSAALPRSGALVVSTRKGMTVEVDGQLLELDTSVATVREALLEVGLVLHAGDQLSVPLEAAAVDGLEIAVTRATTVAGTVTQTMKFGEREVEDSSRAKGTRVVQQQGRVGEREVTYTATVVDGVEVERTVLASVIVTEPQDRVILVGTMEVPDVPPVKPGTAKAIAKELAAKRGWGDDEFKCLVALWQKESGWRVDAHNKSSGAYGIPQALPGTKMAKYGDDWRTNPETQIKWGLAYIDGRYDTPCGAWGHFLRKNWY